MRDFSARSYAEPNIVPPEYSCMWSEVIHGYCKLYERYDHVVTKRKHIWKLAQPKHKKLKYHQEFKCRDMSSHEIEIIDKTDRVNSTRTEQLAFPKLRQLNHLKNHSSFSSFNNTRKSGVNRLIRKSLLSVYSRLQNVIPDEKRPESQPWSVETKTRVMNHLKTLALPKKPPTERKDIKKSKKTEGGPKMKRIKKLSKPKVYNEVDAKEWMLTKALKDYRPSERVIQISQPKRYDQTYDEDPLRTRTNALRYKATQRIRALAEPAKSKGRVEDKTENPFHINSKALKAIASKRVKELATPKDYSDMNNRADAYRVSRNALRAKASPRLIELAEPKKY